MGGRYMSPRAPRWRLSQLESVTKSADDGEQWMLVAVRRRELLARASLNASRAHFRALPRRAGRSNERRGKHQQQRQQQQAGSLVGASRRPDTTRTAASLSLAV